MMTEEQKKLVEENHRLALYIANKLYCKYDHHYRFGLDFDDYVSICYMAMCKAAMTWNPERSKFSTYYPQVALNDLRRIFRDSRRGGRKAMFNSVSFDTLMPDGEKGWESYLDLFPYKSPGPEEQVDTSEEYRDALRAIDNVLSDKEQAVITLSIFADKTQQDIGKLLGITQPHVSRLNGRAKRKLYEAMKEVGYG